MSKRSLRLPTRAAAEQSKGAGAAGEQVPRSSDQGNFSEQQQNQALRTLLAVLVLGSEAIQLLSERRLMLVASV